MSSTDMTLNTSDKTYKEFKRRLLGRFRRCNGGLKDRGEEMAEYLAKELGYNNNNMPLEEKTEIMSLILNELKASGEISVSDGSLYMDPEVMLIPISRKSVKNSQTKPGKAHRDHHRTMPRTAASRFS